MPAAEKSTQTRKHITEAAREYIFQRGAPRSRDIKSGIESAARSGRSSAFRRMLLKRSRPRGGYLKGAINHRRPTPWIRFGSGDWPSRATENSRQTKGIILTMTNDARDRSPAQGDPKKFNFPATPPAAGQKIQITRSGINVVASQRCPRVKKQFFFPPLPGPLSRFPLESTCSTPRASDAGARSSGKFPSRLVGSSHVEKCPGHDFINLSSTVAASIPP